MRWPHGIVLGTVLASTIGRTDGLAPRQRFGARSPGVQVAGRRAWLQGSRSGGLAAGPTSPLIFTGRKSPSTSMGMVMRLNGGSAAFVPAAMSLLGASPVDRLFNGLFLSLVMTVVGIRIVCSQPSDSAAKGAPRPCARRSLILTPAMHVPHNNPTIQLTCNSCNTCATETAPKTASDKALQALTWRFLPVFWLFRLADWLQGPYFYEVDNNPPSQLPDSTLPSTRSLTSLLLSGGSSCVMCHVP